MKDLFVLDACALIAYFREENGYQKVEDLFTQAIKKSLTVVIHKITLTEVIYDLLRTTKAKTAAMLMADAKRLPLIIIESMSDDLIVLAAEFKAYQKVSFADSFVLALARLNNATVVTADHHEFSPIEKSGTVKFLWIR